MDANTVAALGSVGPGGSPPRTELLPSATRATASFEDWVSNEIGALNTQMLRAEQGVRALAAGSATSVHEVMIDLEQARLAFQLALQVRNRVLEAYQDVMRMQV